MNVLCDPKKQVFCCWIKCSVNIVYIRLTIQLFRSSIFLLIFFCLLFYQFLKKSIQVSYYGSFYFSFQFYKVLPHLLDTPLLGAYMFRIATYSWLIELLCNIYCSSLSQMSTFCDINVSTPCHFRLMLA